MAPGAINLAVGFALRQPSASSCFTTVLISWALSAINTASSVSTTTRFSTPRPPPDGVRCVNNSRGCLRQSRGPAAHFLGNPFVLRYPRGHSSCPHHSSPHPGAAHCPVLFFPSRPHQWPHWGTWRRLPVPAEGTPGRPCPARELLGSSSYLRRQPFSSASMALARNRNMPLFQVKYPGPGTALLWPGRASHKALDRYMGNSPTENASLASM